MVKKILFWFYTRIIDFLMIFSLPKMIRETAGNNIPITFADFFRQKILGKYRTVYWQVHPQSVIRGARNIFAGIEVSPGWEKGCYIQAINPIYIGDYTLIANNVGIISANHDFSDFRKHVRGGPVIIGSYCWLGMGSIILPEVELGDFTIVGAGAVVTKSFPMGHCVIAGNPARLIRELNKEECIRYHSEHEYYGFYKKGVSFNSFAEKRISTATKKIMKQKGVL